MFDAATRRRFHREKRLTSRRPLQDPVQARRGRDGVVYEAEDTNLGRHVALKFLPLAIAGAEHFIVMELLDGESLADRIRRGPVDDAMIAIHKAWESGYRDPTWTRQDPDLSPLHGHPEFERLYPPPA